MKSGRAEIAIYQKIRIKNLRRGDSEVRFKKKLDCFNVRNVAKPPQPQFFAQRAPEG